MEAMKGGTLFSGIASAEVAAPEIQWRWQAEIDPFACAVLNCHFPEIPNLGDVTRIDPDAIEPVDICVFGSPCQSFSVAGGRLGLDDPRGNLALLALSLVKRIRPKWLVFENVPGLFSSFSGSEQQERQVLEGSIGCHADGAEDRDFATFLSRVRECGYLGGWRVFDAQYFGVPQRRRRIYFVGHLADWRPPVAVLFEPQSLRRDSAPGRGEEQGIAAKALCSTDGGIDREDRHTLLIADPLTGHVVQAFGGNRQSGPLETATAVRAKGGTGHGDFESETFIVAGTVGAENIRHTTGMESQNEMLVFESRFARNGRGAPEEVVQPLKAQSGSTGRGDGAPLLTASTGIRRLTPRECERLQGLPDDWTLIDYRGRPAADGPRYRAIGNAMAGPVIGWVLSRIRQFEEECR